MPLKPWHWPALPCPPSLLLAATRGQQRRREARRPPRKEAGRWVEGRKERFSYHRNGAGPCDSQTQARISSIHSPIIHQREGRMEAEMGRV